MANLGWRKLNQGRKSKQSPVIQAAETQFSVTVVNIALMINEEATDRKFAYMTPSMLFSNFYL